MEESSGESSEAYYHTATPTGMSMLQIGVLDHNNISIFCVACFNVYILNLWISNSGLLYTFTQHAEGHFCPVSEFIFYECFPGGASVTGDKRGTHKAVAGRRAKLWCGPYISHPDIYICVRSSEQLLHTVNEQQAKRRNQRLYSEGPYSQQM